jgi:curved DNA-binding protein CbpA
VAKFKDYYQVLGVPPRSHVRIIEDTYWERAHELKGTPTRKAQQRLHQLNEAYETLGSPYRRQEYDRRWVRAEAAAQPEPRAGLLHVVLSVLGKPFRPD